MITTPEQYNAYLAAIQNANFPLKTPPFTQVPVALLDGNHETVYKIDLNTRLINSPELIGIEKDHAAETIYFEVDRYYDYVDLKDTVCIVQYINAKGDARLYPVPFYDIATKAKDNKMLIPWNVSAGATEVAGTVKYSLCFYKLDAANKLIYNLNTQIATTKVLYGMEPGEFEENYSLDVSQYNELISKIEMIERDGLYWTDLYSY